MPSQSYDIYFSGQIMDGNDPAKTREQIGQIFKANANQLNKLFSGTPVKIKSDVDEKTATRYRIAFRKAGALIEIKLSSASTNTTAVTSNPIPEETEGLTLLPPNTGSLIDCAAKVIPQPIPNIDHVSLASVGSIIDDSPAPKPVEIDTSGLSVNPPNSGTLEDCKKEAKPYPIPNISHLDLDKN